jgi:arginine repressor
MEVIRCIESFVDSNPSYTQQEVTAHINKTLGLNVSRPTVCRWMQRMRRSLSRSRATSLSSSSSFSLAGSMSLAALAVELEKSSSISTTDTEPNVFTDPQEVQSVEELLLKWEIPEWLMSPVPLQSDELGADMLSLLGPFDGC